MAHSKNPNEPVQVQADIWLHAYYEPNQRAWWAYYYSVSTGRQIGDAWFDHSRDGVLVRRPPTPEVPTA